MGAVMRGGCLAAGMLLGSAVGGQVTPAVPREGLLLWLDAADHPTVHVEGDRVIRWDSKAPGTELSVTSMGSQQPRFVDPSAQLLRPSIRFDGVNDVLRCREFGQKASTWSLVVIAAPRGSGGLCSTCPVAGNDFDPGFTVDLYQSRQQFDQVSIEGVGRMGGQQDQMRSAHAFGGMHVIVAVRDHTEVTLFIDGALEGARRVTPGETVMDELRVGARHYGGRELSFFRGDIAQILLYARVLTDEERAAIESVMAVPQGERKAGEEVAMAEEKRRREQRMVAPQVIRRWPTIADFLAEDRRWESLDGVPVRTDIREAVALSVTHLTSLFDRDRDDEPFFYLNCEADGTGRMHHSVPIGIPHVVGRCLLGCMIAEDVVGIPFPEEGLSILERYCRQSFDNPDHLNSYIDPEKERKRFIEFHNMREGLYALWALAEGRDRSWAGEKARLMLAALDRLTDEQGRWSPDLAAKHGMQERCSGLASANSARVIDPLLAYHRLTGNPLALRLAGLYARDGLQTLFTEDGHFASMDRSSGHVHSITSSLSGIAAYAVHAGDAGMLAACRRIMAVGVPEYHSSWGWGDEVFPEHPADVQSRGEINQTGDVVRTALILGHAGYPEYYELAECYLRSMLLPTQHREAQLRTFLRDKAEPAGEAERNVVRRGIGGYSMQLPNDRMREGDWPVSTLDITSGAAHAMSECWRHRVSTDADSAHVNLLLDAETDELTVTSSLPFQGRIEVRPKRNLDLHIRVPPWVDRETVRLQIDGERRTPRYANASLHLGRMTAGSVGTATFAIPCRVEKETVDGIVYTTTWVGNQIIAIEPRGAVSPLPF